MGAWMTRMANFATPRPVSVSCSCLRSTVSRYHYWHRVRRRATEPQPTALDLLHVTTIQVASDTYKMALLNVGTVIGGWLVISTVGSLYLKSTISATSMAGMLLGNPVAMALLFFNYLNIFIALCEIALGRHAELIKKDYLALKEQFKGKEWDGCLAFLLMPLSVGQIFDMKTWSKMWTTYALCEYSETDVARVVCSHSLETFESNRQSSNLKPQTATKFLNGCTCRRPIVSEH